MAEAPLNFPADSLTVPKPDLVMQTEARLKFLAAADYNNKQARLDWQDLLLDHQIAPIDEGEILFHGVPVESDPHSSDLGKRNAAILEGKNLPQLRDFDVISYDYSTKSLSEAGIIPQETSVNLRKLTSLENYTARLLVNRDYLNFKCGRNISTAVKDADIVFEVFPGWASRFEVVGSFVSRTMFNLSKRNISSVAIFSDAVGQFRNGYFNYRKILEDPYLYTLQQYSFASEVSKTVLGLSPAFYGRKPRELIGHSRGGADLFEGYHNDPLVGELPIAPIVGHRGGNPILAELLLGRGTQLIGLLDKMPHLQEFAKSRVVPALTRRYVGKEYDNLLDLYLSAYDETLSLVLASHLIGLYSKGVRDLSNVDPKIFQIVQFESDPFKNRNYFNKALQESLKGKYNDVVTELPGGHHAYNMDEQDPTHQAITNNRIITNKAILIAVELVKRSKNMNTQKK